MSPEERKKRLELYINSYAVLIEALEKFPVAMWTFKPGPAQWSIHEIIIHITDSEVNSYLRCRRFIAEPGKMVLGYDQDVWAQKLNYHSCSVKEALALFQLLRKTSYDIIKDLPPETWLNTVLHSENGLMNMDDWLTIYSDHVQGHIRQMERVYNLWKTTGIGYN